MTRAPATGRPEPDSVTVPWIPPVGPLVQLGNLNAPILVYSKNGAGSPTYSAVNQNVQSSAGSRAIEL